MRGLGAVGLAAAAAVLVVIGLASGGAGSTADDAAIDDATPPAIVVNGVPVGPGGYDWYSAGTGTFRRMPAQDRPHRPDDFVAVQPAHDGALTIRLDGFDPMSQVEVAFFTGVGPDGQPLAAVDARRWSGSTDGDPVQVVVPEGTGFVAVTVAEAVPDLPSALPEDRTARYGVRLADPQPDRGAA